jgi:hypothetical protein
MIQEKVKIADKLAADISTQAVPPRNPCPKCGKETVRDHEPGWSICTNEKCRERIPPPQS